MTNNNEVYLVAFYFYIFFIPKLNYNVYDKELLAIFEAFQIWWYYLEGFTLPIDVVMDHKNLEYFSTTKVFIYQQAK